MIPLLIEWFVHSLDSFGALSFLYFPGTSFSGNRLPFSFLPATSSGSEALVLFALAISSWFSILSSAWDLLRRSEGMSVLGPFEVLLGMGWE